MPIVYLITHYGLPAVGGAVLGLAYSLLARKNNALPWATAGAFIAAALVALIVR